MSASHITCALNENLCTFPVQAFSMQSLSCMSGSIFVCAGRKHDALCPRAEISNNLISSFLKKLQIRKAQVTLCFLSFQ